MFEDLILPLLKYFGINLLLGNNKQANFWDSDETEHSAETLVDAGNIDYGE